MKKLLLLLAVALLFSNTSSIAATLITLDEDQVSPVTVVFAAGEVPAGYEVTKLYDLNLDTFSVIRDDSLDGTSATTAPPYAAAPTTGHLIFDLGEEMNVDGIELFSRKYNGRVAPKGVDFFYYADDDPTNNTVVDDIENDSDIILLAGDEVGAIVSGASWEKEWTSVTARYIGMRFNSSYRDTAGQTSFNVQLSQVAFSTAATVPEPSTVVLLLTLTLGLVTLSRRRIK